MFLYVKNLKKELIVLFILLFILAIISSKSSDSLKGIPRYVYWLVLGRLFMISLNVGFS